MSLPPLPKSLGIELTQQQQQQQLLMQQQQFNHSNYQNIIQMQQHQQNHLNSFDSQRSLNSSSSSSISRKTTSTLDTQLTILKKEMYSLRQLDLNLLSQLWSLNESIQEYRTLLQEQENLSPNSPNSISNSDDDESNEDRNNNLIHKNLSNIKERDVEHDFIEDMHQKLEKQIRKMNVAPPLPPQDSKKNLKSPQV